MRCLWQLMDDVILVSGFLFGLTQKPCLIFEDSFLELQIFDTMCFSIDVCCTCKLIRGRCSNQCDGGMKIRRLKQKELLR